MRLSPVLPRLAAAAALAALPALTLPPAFLVLAAGSARAAEEPAVETVRRLYTAFEAALKDGDVKARAATLKGPLNETIDFPAMVRLAVGSKWAGFTPEQQGALTDAFAENFVATYATRLAQAKGGKFEVEGKAEARGPNRLVLTRVANAEGDDSQVDYLVGPNGRIQDVFLNGNVSEVGTRRASFGDPLKSGGADGLLKFLRDRTASMLAAKPAP